MRRTSYEWAHTQNIKIFQVMSNGHQNNLDHLVMLILKFWQCSCLKIFAIWPRNQAQEKFDFEILTMFMPKIALLFDRDTRLRKNGLKNSGQPTRTLVTMITHLFLLITPMSLRLCDRGPQQLYHQLETQGREYADEVKFHLLEHLLCHPSSIGIPQHAREFAQTLLDEYEQVGHGVGPLGWVSLAG